MARYRSSGGEEEGRPHGHSHHEVADDVAQTIPSLHSHAGMELVINRRKQQDLRTQEEALRRGQTRDGNVQSQIKQLVRERKALENQEETLQKEVRPGTKRTANGLDHHPERDSFERIFEPSSPGSHPLQGPDSGQWYGDSPNNRHLTSRMKRNTEEILVPHYRARGSSQHASAGIQGGSALPVGGFDDGKHSAQDDNDVDSLCANGKRLAMMGNGQAAEVFFQRALQLEPTHIKTLGGYAALLHEQGDHQNAQIMYESALRQAKRSALSPRTLASAVDTLCNMGRLLKDVAHDQDRAERMFRRALQLDRSHVDALCGYAELLYSGRGDMGKATKLLERALQIEPKHAGALVARAWMQQTTSFNKHDLEQQYTDILALYPNHSGALCNFGLYMHSIKGNLTKAEQLYRRALQGDPKHLNSLTNYAALCQLQGKHQEAEKLYLRALEVYPEQVDVLNNYGMLLHTVLGDYDKAEELYQKALQVDPEQVDTLLSYAQLLKQVRGDHARANQLLRRASALQNKVQRA